MRVCLSLCRRDESQQTKRRTARSSDAPRLYPATTARRGRWRPIPIVSCCCVSPASYRQHLYSSPSKASTFVLKKKAKTDADAPVSCSYELAIRGEAGGDHVALVAVKGPRVRLRHVVGGEAPEAEALVAAGCADSRVVSGEAATVEACHAPPQVSVPVVLCTSKASKLGTWVMWREASLDSAGPRAILDAAHVPYHDV